MLSLMILMALRLQFNSRHDHIANGVFDIGRTG